MELLAANSRHRSVTLPVGPEDHPTSTSVRASNTAARLIALPPKLWLIVAAGLALFLAAAFAKAYIADLGPPLGPDALLDPAMSPWRLAVSRFVPWVLWIPFAGLVLWISAELNRHVRSLWVIAALHASASFAIAALHIVATVAVNVQILDHGQFFLARLFARFYLLDWEVLAYWAMLGAGYAYHFAARTSERELRTAQLEARLNAERLHTLLLQLNPHFLFNTLNAIAGLVQTGERDVAVTTIARLGALLRTTLQGELGQETTLKDEIVLLQRYIDIESVRFGDRLTVRVDVPTSVAGALVPTLILQPLVENAILHGIGRHTGPGSVSIAATRSADLLRLTICNSHQGAPPNGQRPNRLGLGLSNSRERLARLYGPRARLAVEPHSSRGFSVYVELPYHVTSAKGYDEQP